MSAASQRRRRPHGGPHSTPASEAPCRHCRRPLLYAWDDGLLARADAAALDEPVAVALREAGRRVYVLTQGRSLVHESVERYPLRLAVSRHAEHVCRAAPAPAPRYENLELFDLDTRPPARGNGGMW